MGVEKDRPPARGREIITEFRGQHQSSRKTFLHSGVYILSNLTIKVLVSVSLVLLLVFVTGAVTPAFASTQSTKVHSKTHRKHTKKVKRAGAWKKHGQHEIDADRARDIQEALIRQHYMTGTASGVWDNDTKAAMAKFQKDQGWQAKRIPDARALIKLGLGPTHETNTSTQVAGPTATAVSPSAVDTSQR